jgi:hypothetical protein
MAGDTSGVLQLATNGSTTAVTIDTSQNVGIGTASPAGDVTRYLNIVGSGGAGIFLHDSNQGVTASDGTTLQAAGVNTYLYNREAGFIAFGTSNIERMRIDSSGQVLINATSNPTASVGQQYIFGATTYKGTVNPYNPIVFYNSSNALAGYIGVNGTVTSYISVSDYRLKENVVPMIGALDKIAQLKPVTYTWKVDGSIGQGFIAHELQAVVPDCVTGEKDAVETYTDEEGDEQTRIKPQGVDTSFLVATLTAAIQEQQTIINDLKARITALEGAA